MIKGLGHFVFEDPANIIFRSLRICRVEPQYHLSLWLTWKQSHITNQYFVAEVLAISRAIRKTRPKTVGALRKCFGARWMNPSSNFTRSDMDGYMPEALPFFTEEKTATYTIAECAKRPCARSAGCEGAR